MPAHGDLDRDRITRLLADELVRFRADRPVTMALLERARAHMPNGVPMAWMASDNDQPVYIAHGEGAGFTDVDGFTYVDTNASDMAMFGGHANPAIVRAVTDQVTRSTQFLLPTEDSIAVAEELSRRYPGRPIGSSPCRPPRPTPKRSAWLARSPAERWSSCSTATTTGISTRASWNGRRASMHPSSEGCRRA